MIDCAYEQNLNAEYIEGKIEADETFFALSYKGNHSKSAYSMPREPHKRGNSVHKKGLSKEQVCVPCAISGQQAVGKVACLGTASTAALKYTLNNRLTTGSILATDGKPGYAVIAQENNVELHYQPPRDLYNTSTTITVNSRIL